MGVKVMVGVRVIVGVGVMVGVSPPRMLKPGHAQEGFGRLANLKICKISDVNN